MTTAIDNFSNITLGLFKGVNATEDNTSLSELDVQDVNTPAPKEFEYISLLLKSDQVPSWFKN